MSFVADNFGRLPLAEREYQPNLFPTKEVILYHSAENSFCCR